MTYVEGLYYILDLLEDEMGRRYIEFLAATMDWKENKTEKSRKRLAECEKRVEEIGKDIKSFKEMHREELEEA